MQIGDLKHSVRSFLHLQCAFLVARSSCSMQPLDQVVDRLVDEGVDVRAVR